ncbi:hypothetical protein CF54_20575 [Streptomyces sp. Tu 6176]|uniref:ATP-grasp domain-containing protein n=1 Tax=Streptomyces sp. Tu 6176 TaxID=1470557 RepID=UPI00044A0D2F|nr:ATP-grasp domain-containing protein [Streptomyces sp. Tu 6176]EYT81281.1 hypothetical protein CF54_20575 [Streptomyces sp. Tu 6176]
MANAFSPRPTGAEHDILYLGWQREAVEALGRLGARVACVVSSSDRFKPTDEGFDGPLAVAADHTSPESVLGALDELGLSPGAFWTVCTEDEFAIVTAAVLGSLGCRRAVPVAGALSLRDKAAQKRLIRRAGLPVAACVRVPDLAAVERAVSSHGIGLPCVVKPPAGAGSQHTHVVRDRREMSATLDALAEEAGGTVGPWLVEAFVPGEELHIDGAVRDGKLVLASASRYLHNVVEVHHGRLVASATLDDVTERELTDAAVLLTERALTALHHTDGVFHLEAFHEDGVLTFSECAGRIGGGMVLEAVRGKYGTDLYDEWAAAVLDVPSPTPADAGEPRPGSFGWANLTAPPGPLRNLPTRGDIEARPGVVEAQLWAKEGDLVDDMRRASHLLAAKALVHAPTEEAARARLVEVASWFTGTLRGDERGCGDA